MKETERNPKTFTECNEFLCKKENWTPLLFYVHRTRIIAGLILGLAIGVLVGWGVWGQ